jgi:hypothetical protein
MIMSGQSRRLREPLRWGRRERVAIAAVLAVAVMALAGLGIYALTSGSPARRDCVSVTFASTLGGAQLQGCGERARRICASGDFPGIAADLRRACVRAGFPFHAAARPIRG